MLFSLFNHFAFPIFIVKIIVSKPYSHMIQIVKGGFTVPFSTIVKGAIIKLSKGQALNEEEDKQYFCAHKKPCDKKVQLLKTQSL